MSSWHGGKGSAPRPISDKDQFASNWDKIFSKKDEKPLEPFTDKVGNVHTKCGTSKCCGNCRKEREAAKRIPNK